MQFLKNLGTYGSHQGPVSAYFRKRRFGRFLRFVEGIPRPVRILDVGGTRSYWEQLGALGNGEFDVTTLNLQGQELVEPGFRARVSDATDLSDIDAEQYDVVHSNSVIEHLKTWEGQSRMAQGILRLGLPFWIQCPSYWTPLEPHFLTPGWQFFPRTLRYWLIQRRQFGGRGPARDLRHARELVDEIRLLRAKDLSRLFPGATVQIERFGPFQKSIIATGEPA